MNTFSRLVIRSFFGMEGPRPLRKSTVARWRGGGPLCRGILSGGSLAISAFDIVTVGPWGQGTLLAPLASSPPAELPQPARASARQTPISANFFTQWILEDDSIPRQARTALLTLPTPISPGPTWAPITGPTSET